MILLIRLKMIVRVPMMIILIPMMLMLIHKDLVKILMIFHIP